MGWRDINPEGDPTKTPPRGGSAFLLESYDLVGWGLANSIIRRICTNHGQDTHEEDE